jgi:NTP pyrophosphatase (non-canonical NTP hydrolase)
MPKLLNKAEIEKIDNVLMLVRAELIRASENYGEFHSVHEGLGVITEEYFELVDAVRSNNGYEIDKESIQVAAMATRMVVDRTPH